MNNGMNAFFAAVAGIYLILLIALLVWVVVLIVAQVKLFEKAGLEGWKAIIPFYNAIKLSEIGTGKKTLGVIWCAVYAVWMVFYFMQLSMSMFRGSGNGALMLMISLIYMIFSFGMWGVSAGIYFQLGKSFGKSDLWCVLMIFLSGILIIAMGFDKDLKYVGPNGIPSSDQYDVNNYDNNNNYYKY